MSNARGFENALTANPASRPNTSMTVFWAQKEEITSQTTRSDLSDLSSVFVQSRLSCMVLL